ncbi:flagellar hook-basal body complex protein FliE [Rhodovulum sp. 12E13]|uniref:flagellar hook-basal body complex protein FliE n=1 Tax=Rhodovulum sp. 12E13 TaxID=2203891 RepID=UPI000E195A56|nr:flagellar hook-basal body complex protein FliE [Rhodovulum sp. 12E13]RDC74862.1 flagellar hook-basal body complex protein FliE [Rhodovulum sp. 12E13]
MDIRATQAARLYQGAAAPSPSLTAPSSSGPPAAGPFAPGSFGQTATAAARDFAETLGAAERTAQDALVGKADPHALVEALSQSELAVEAAVAVRDRVVEAYQEILRMPV